MSERDLTRMGTDSNKSMSGGPLLTNNHLPSSKSVPALHHHSGSGTICKSSFLCYKMTRKKKKI